MCWLAELGAQAGDGAAHTGTGRLAFAPLLCLPQALMPAVSVLGLQLCCSTGYVIRPYQQYPTLLPKILAVLR